LSPYHFLRSFKQSFGEPPYRYWTGRRIERAKMLKTIFYARVSTRDQKLAAQEDAARRLGVRSEHIFVEKASGTRHDRPVLANALAACEKGDTFAAFKLDRVGRSLVHLVKLLEELEARGVHFMTTEDGLSTKGSTGKLLLHILAAISQFERSLMLERTRAGLAAARARGKVSGRPRKMIPADVKRACKSAS
jgi:DNA invertase Pin-like site-specific DNA recombinase